MSAWDPWLLLAAFLAVLSGEAVLLYASTALGNVGAKLGRFLLAAALAALLSGACVALPGWAGRSLGLGGWAAVAAGGLFVSWAAASWLFAWAFSTSLPRGMLVSAYQLLLRALACLLVGLTAGALLRSFLAA